MSDEQAQHDEQPQDPPSPQLAIANYHDAIVTELKLTRDAAVLSATAVAGNGDQAIQNLTISAIIPREHAGKLKLFDNISVMISINV